MSIVYRHYGSSKFDPDKWISISMIKNRMNKPTPGLWASPVESIRSWYNWCIDEEFNLSALTTHFDFTLRPEAKIYRIDSADSLVSFVQMFPGEELSEIDRLAFCLDIVDHMPDFREAAEVYDGVEVSLSDCPELYRWMYGWDCDSIVIWNISVVDPI